MPNQCRKNFKLIQKCSFLITILIYVRSFSNRLNGLVIFKIGTGYITEENKNSHGGFLQSQGQNLSLCAVEVTKMGRPSPEFQVNQCTSRIPCGSNSDVCYIQQSNSGSVYLLSFTSVKLEDQNYSVFHVPTNDENRLLVRCCPFSGDLGKLSVLLQLFASLWLLPVRVSIQKQPADRDHLPPGKH